MPKRTQKIQANRANHQSTPALSRSKQRLFRVFLYFSPILFFLILEFILRLFNYGGSLDLFISGPGRLQNYYICNREVARRYFVRLHEVPTPANDYFRKQKPANGLRVFVLGESTTNGYPYGYNVMFSRILERRLKEALPDRAIEVVNVSMAAINTYALLDFLDEVLEKEPDALLFYTGHNEYYGALGVASMINFGRNRTFILAYMKLSRCKTFRAVRDIVLWLTNPSVKENVPPTATIMERIVAEQAIPINSALYKAGVKQFEENLRTILAKAAKKQVAVMLSDLTCNVSDLAPFVSLDEAESASAVFNKAVELAKNGNYDHARIEFKKARDLDALRFRAPTAFNDIIYTLAAEYQVPVAAMESTFEATSPHGLVGSNLMIDHLHPTIDGYFLMAEAFFDEMLKAGLIPKVSDSQATAKQFQQSWGYTKLDSLYGDLSIQVLKGGWPFKPHSAVNTALENYKPKDYVEEIAHMVVKYDNVSIRQGHEMLIEHFEKMGDREKVLREYEALVALKSYSALPYLKVCEAFIKSNNPGPVPQLVNESLIFDESPLSYILLGEAYNGLGQYDKAILAFEQAQQLGAAKNDPHVLVGLEYAYTAAGQFEKARQMRESQGVFPPERDAAGESQKIEAYLEKAEKLILEEKFEQAQIELEHSIKIRETSQAHMWIGQIYLEKKQPAPAVQHLEKARQLGSRDPLLFYNLSIALVQQKEYERAWTALEELERLDPNFGDPYELRKKLAGILNQSQTNFQ